MAFGFLHRNKEKDENVQNEKTEPQPPSDESSIVFWCKRNKASSSTAERLLELIENGWNVPKSDAEAIS